MSTSSSIRKALVTGGAGFIGSELVRQLHAAGADVVVVDDLSTGRRVNLVSVDGARVRLIVADVRDERRLTEAMRGVEVVFHLACRGVRHSLHSPGESHAVNATGALTVLEAARRTSVSRLVYVSSSEVYGTARWVPMTEDHPTFPATVYGAAKLAGEGYARAYHRAYGFPAVVVRPFNAYGPHCHHEGDSGEVIPKFVLRSLAGRSMVVFGDGRQTRDFTYVTDTARGILQAAHVDDAIGETINLGSGREVTINDLASEVAAVTGRQTADIVHDAPRPGDVLRLCADSVKARGLLSFEPRVGLRDGLGRVRDWYGARGQDLPSLLAEDVVRNWQPVAASSGSRQGASSGRRGGGDNES
jgi:UDP-glucose 4-epimerase